VLAVVRGAKNFHPAEDPLPGGAGRPKFHQLEMVTILTYKTGSMHTISSYRGNRPTHKHAQTALITIHCAAASEQCKKHYTGFNVCYNSITSTGTCLYLWWIAHALLLVRHFMITIILSITCWLETHHLASGSTKKHLNTHWTVILSGTGFKSRLLFTTHNQNRLR